VGFQSGTRLGPYEILSVIGAGGMGEVYSARDTRLNRNVALKVLPEVFASDVERMARFEREAKLLASLNHPNIAAIHGLEESGSTRALVMELVEGPTLAERIAAGPIPLDEALPIAKQVAEALEYAHDHNVIHRDLKPANVKVTAEGTVKVLDFGLAKALADDPASESLSNSPTLSAMATRQGVILGTAAYMSPEQARGKTVDKRTDIWAFGAVLYEMLTGRTAFKGEDVTETLAAVVMKEPALETLPPTTPAAIRKLLLRCLQKDKTLRMRDAGDVRIEIQEALAAPNDVGATSAVSTPRSKLPWTLATVLAIVAASVSFVHFREAPSSEDVMNVSISVPLDSTPVFLALSPDGLRLAVGLANEGKYQLYLRSLDSPEYRLFPGTEHARMPFWSADSRFIGFFAEGQLKTIPAVGGPATTLCSGTGLGYGGTWNRDGVILFASEDGTLRRVKASGGACSGVPLDNHSIRAVTPEFLPDGNHFFYVNNVADPSAAGVYLAALDNPKARKVLNDVSSVLYSPPTSGQRLAHLLFRREATLMAQPFDGTKLEDVGDPFAVTSPVSFSSTSPQVAASVAPNGTLVYFDRSLQRQLTWLDRSGHELGKVGTPGNLGGVAISPDGNTIAVNDRGQGATTSNSMIWLHDVARGSKSRFTQSGNSSFAAVWSPDSQRVTYASSIGTQLNLFLKDVNGGEQETPLLSPSTNLRAPSDWSRDGRFLIYTSTDPKTQADIWYLPDPGKPGSKPVKFLATDASESQGQLSPDGRWLAYFSNQSGGLGDVFIRPFPSGSGEWKVSVNGGREPRWSRDGKELFYLERFIPKSVLMAVAIHPDASSGLQLGTPDKLFEFQNSIGYTQQLNLFSYSPHPDGRRFLVMVDANAETAPVISVITNWKKLNGDRVPRSSSVMRELSLKEQIAAGTN
jgi:serine/threonine protein kinase